LGRRRRKKRSAQIEDNKVKQTSGPQGEYSITSLLKKINFTTLGGQLRSIADNMEMFGEMSELMEQVDVFVKPKQSGQKSPFNLGKILQNKESLNHLIQAVMPALQNIPDEKPDDPIVVEKEEKEEKKRKKK